MANPYGIPEDSVALTHPGSSLALRDANQRAADSQAKSEYAKFLMDMQREQRLATNTTAAGGWGPKNLGALNQLISDPMADPAAVAQAKAVRDQILGVPAPDPNAPAQPVAPEKPKEQGAFRKAAGEVGEFAQTTAAAAAGGLVKLPGDLMTLFGSDKYGPAISAAGESLKQEFTPEDVKMRATELKRMIDDDTVSAIEVGKFIGTNPDLMAYFGGEFLGGGFGASLGVKGAAKLLAATGAASKIGAQAAKIPGLRKVTEAGAQATGIASTMSLGEVGGIQNSVYQQVLQNTGDEAKAAEARAEVLKQPEIWAAAALGTIPIAEYTLALRKIPSLKNLPFYKRVPAAGGLEAGQEYGQETGQAAGEAAAMGDQRSFGERFTDPATQKQGVVGMVTGGVIGTLAGIPGGGPADPNAPKPVDPNAPPAAGAGNPIAARAAKIPDLQNLINVAIAAAPKKPDPAGWLTKQLENMPAIRGTPELMQAIPGFVQQSLAGQQGQTAQPAATAAPAGTPTAAATGEPAVTPAAATTAPTAAPVAASAPTEQQQQAAQVATNQTTGAAPPIAEVATQVRELLATIETAEKAAATAEKKPEQIAEKVAEVVFDGSDQEVSDVLMQEQKSARETLGRIEAAMEVGRAATTQIRNTIRNYAFRSAKIRGLSDEQASAYAEHMATYVTVPTARGMEPGALETALNNEFTRVDADYSRAYGISPYTSDLGFGISDQQRNVLRSMPSTGTDLGLGQGLTDQQRRGIQQGINGPGNDLGFGVSPAERELFSQPPNMLGPDLGLGQGLTEDQRARFSPPGIGSEVGVNAPAEPNMDLPLEPEAAKEFLRLLNEGTPQSLDRAQEILNQAKAFAPNVDPFDQEYSDTLMQEQETTKPKRNRTKVQTRVGGKLASPKR
jgi:hypothetical protein